MVVSPPLRLGSRRVVRRAREVPFPRQIASTDRALEPVVLDDVRGAAAGTAAKGYRERELARVSQPGGVQRRGDRRPRLRFRTITGRLVRDVDDLHRLRTVRPAGEGE